MRAGRRCRSCTALSVCESRGRLCVFVCGFDRVCPPVNASVAPWVCVYTFMTLAVRVLFLSAVSMRQKSRQLQTRLQINQLRREATSRPLCERGQLNLTHTHTRTHSLCTGSHNSLCGLNMSCMCVLEFIALSLFLFNISFMCFIIDA